MIALLVTLMAAPVAVDAPPALVRLEAIADGVAEISVPVSPAFLKRLVARGVPQLPPGAEVGGEALRDGRYHRSVRMLEPLAELARPWQGGPVRVWFGRDPADGALFIVEMARTD